MMSLLHLHHDLLRGAAGERRLDLARAFRRLRAAFRVMHRAIVTAKLRRIERETMFHADDGGNLPARDAANYPQRPLILGDKWDF
jgi:hypothetical protein